MLGSEAIEMINRSVKGLPNVEFGQQPIQFHSNKLLYRFGRIESTLLSTDITESGCFSDNQSLGNFYSSEDSLEIDNTLFHHATGVWKYNENISQLLGHQVVNVFGTKLFDTFNIPLATVIWALDPDIEEDMLIQAISFEINVYQDRLSVYYLALNNEIEDPDEVTFRAFKEYFGQIGFVRDLAQLGRSEAYLSEADGEEVFALILERMCTEKVARPLLAATAQALL